jgi:glycosyltransferase involved in cell wall biosynthesis
MDDDLFNIPPEFELPYKYFSRKDVQNGLVAFMTNSDAVIASTIGLAQQLGSVMSAHTKEDKKIYIIENGIDAGWWSDAREVRAKNRMQASDVVIGWFGSGSHKGEMRLIREAAANILRSNPNVKFSFVGLFDWKDFGDEYNDVRDRVTMINWLSYERLKNWMCHIDIGLAPIADIPFNLGKSAIKWLQYGAMEVPCIASNVGPYKTAKNAENIILCSNTTQEWTDAMLDLVNDVQKRREIGRNAFLEASSRWSDYDHASKIVAVCEAAMKEKCK